eukprot:TRINITY_DN27567_c0_g1_i1.p1 TRINITY_DN27567_c0_g1~~TRINITY_DN27567_c0_g1_i1.p1  ORF type:complete len:480 (+),score=85.85 TRINITY_DN27567_c0_g1_i1:80-1441(+)
MHIQRPGEGDVRGSRSESLISLEGREQIRSGSFLEALNAPTATPKFVSLQSVVWNIANTMMGVGIMSLAGAMAQVGVIGAIVVGLGFCSLTFVTVMLLVDGASAADVSTYEDLARRLAGSLGEFYAQLSLVGINVMACIAFLVSVKDMASFALTRMLDMSSDTYHERLVLLVAVLFINLPLTFLRSINALQYTSLFAILCLTWFASMSLVLVPWNEDETLACKQLDAVPAHQPVLMPTNLGDCLAGICCTMTSFICQISVFPIWGEMRAGDKALDLPVEQTRHRFRRALLVALSICGLLYLAAAVGGYFTFFAMATKVDVIINCYDPARWYVLATYVGMVAVCLFSYPLVQFSCRFLLLRMLGYPDAAAAPYFVYVLVGVGFLGTTAIPAIFLKNLNQILAVGSAICAAPVVLQLPSISGIKLGNGARQRHACWALLCFGVLLHIVSVVSALR